MNRGLAAAGGVVFAAALAVGGVVVVTGHTSASADGAPAGPGVVAPAGAGRASSIRPTPSTARTPSGPASPLTVVSVAHAGATTAPGQLGAVTVTFSAPVGSDVSPTLLPALTGSWTHPSETTAVFVPTQVPLPGQQMTVTVPAGTTGTGGGRLAAASTTTWSNRDASPVRLQQLLGETGTLPLSFTPTATEPTTAAGVAATAYAPVAGSWAWRFTPPAALEALYTGPTSTLLTHAGVLSFQRTHGLGVDGVAGPQVWTALTSAAAARTTSSRPYTYVLVSKSSPESLTVYQDGVRALTTPANTGVAAAATPNGSWAVYARFQSQTMSGTNPDGTHYSDPGVPWISYFLGGDAVHGFPRSSYGSPQSVGCVELPIATAKAVYALMDYGDIVTVQG